MRIHAVRCAEALRRAAEPARARVHVAERDAGTGRVERRADGEADAGGGAGHEHVMSAEVRHSRHPLRSLAVCIHVPQCNFTSPLDWRIVSCHAAFRLAPVQVAQIVCWGIMPSGMLRHPLFAGWLSKAHL